MRAGSPWRMGRQYGGAGAGEAMESRGHARRRATPIGFGYLPAIVLHTGWRGRAPGFEEVRLIRLHELTKSYGAQPAVRGITLEIPDGQLVGLLGPNGAGKTTTIRMLTGMLAPTSGTAEVEGADVVRDPLAVKRVVGYVPESGAVFEALTAQEYLRFIASLYAIPDGEAEARIGRFAQFFELDEPTLRKPLSTYSKGMRQKVVITSALLHNPRVVLF